MPAKKPLILLTGAAGRVGRLVRPVLRDRFDLRLSDVAAIDDTAEGETLLIGDLAEPVVAEAAVSGAEGVIHLAGLVAPKASFEDTLGPNYRAVLNLLEACRRREVRRFVFASSHHVLGMLPSDRTYDDREPVAPDGFYALSKAFGEAACAMYAHRFGIQTLVIRIGNADPQVVDGRRERMWTSGRDLGRLIASGLAGEGPTYGIAYGVSSCPAALFPRGGRSPSHAPEDGAADHRAADFKPLSDMGPADGVGLVGGPFAVTDLPAPGDRP